MSCFFLKLRIQEKGEINNFQTGQALFRDQDPVKEERIPSAIQVTIKAPSTAVPVSQSKTETGTNHQRDEFQRTHLSKIHLKTT